MQKTKRNVRKILDALGLIDVELSIFLTNDATIRKLNAEWRHLDKATDVLSFPQHEGVHCKPRLLKAPVGLMLGDIVVSVQTAKRQARAIGHNLEAELQRLLVHGILHLLGHEHSKKPAKAKKMQSEEKRLLRRLVR